MENTQDKFDASDAVYIIDAYGLIYRSYYAFLTKPLTYQGNNISCIFGFFRNLHSLLKKYNPKYLVTAFDSKTKTFRHDMYPQYKATRQKTPEDLHSQVPQIEQILHEMGLCVLQKDKYEADDIIATITKRCKENNLLVRILTGDKDLMQLADEKCEIMKPDKVTGGWSICGRKEIKDIWGVCPEELLDLLSLMGDTADNIPGVLGIGPKTASKLVGEYRNLEGIYENIDKIAGSTKNKLQNGKDSAFFSRKLIKLQDDVLLDFDIEDFSCKNFNYGKLSSSLYAHGVPSCAENFAKLAKENATGEEATESEQTNTDDLQKNICNYKAATCIEDLESFVELCIKNKICAFDSETTGLDTFHDRIVGFSLSYQSGDAIYVPIAQKYDLFSCDIGIEKKAAFSCLEKLFNNPNIKIILHNAKFDLKILHSNGFNFTGPYNMPCCTLIDTMVAAWLVSPNLCKTKGSYTLSELCKKYMKTFGIEFSDIVPKGKHFYDVPIEKAKDYGAEDADFTFTLWTHLQKELESQELLDLFFDIEMKLLPILCSMEISGIHLDTKKLKDYGRELSFSIAQLENEIYKEAGHSFNISSSVQVQDVLFKDLGLPATKKSKTGWSCDNEVLKDLGKYARLPLLILQYRGLSKLLSTYVVPLPSLIDENDRVHTAFIQTGTATGRLSSRDPNLQNIPIREAQGRIIRSAFTAPQGHILISSDYSQIELVVLAHLSKDKTLQDAFLNKKDIHKATAALIFKTTEDKVTQEQRQIAKTINFGVIYGMSSFSLAKQLDITRKDADSFIDSYFQTYSTLKTFIEETIQEARQNGFVKTLFGRKRYIQDISNKNKTIQAAAQRVAVNTKVQGTAADIVKLAMIKTAKELEEKKCRAELLLQVHDELIVECEDDKKMIEQATNIIRQCMQTAANLSVPLKVSIECGKSWGEFH